MSLLSYTEICELIDKKVIEGADIALVNATSLDIRLGNKIATEVKPYKQPKVSLKNKEPLVMAEIDIPEYGYTLEPGEFILAHSLEIFHLPNHISAEYKLKSSMARVGLEHLNAGWCDAGWNNSVLTLELKNMTRYHSIALHAGDKIGQMIFWNHKIVPNHASYAVKGRYNGDKKVSGVKKDPVPVTQDLIDRMNCRGGNCE